MYIEACISLRAVLQMTSIRGGGFYYPITWVSILHNKKNFVLFGTAFCENCVAYSAVYVRFAAVIQPSACASTCK